MSSRNEIASALGILPVEEDFEINGVSALSEPAAGTLSFVKVWSPETEQLVSEHADTLFLVPVGARGDSLPSNALPVENPRLMYARVLRDQLTPRRVPTISTRAHIEDGAVIGRGVSIGHFSVVEAGAVVEDDCVIDSHVVIKSGVKLGARTVIGPHTSLGGTGFGFEVDDDGVPVRIQHRGGLEIANDVEVGAHVTVAQGTIQPTRIGPHVKIDDQVFIAHNVQVGEGAFIIAGAEISGSVSIGARAWISPEAAVINQVTIGADALVGIGAVVIRDVAANTVVAGVPAKERGPRYPE